MKFVPSSSFLVPLLLSSKPHLKVFSLPSSCGAVQGRAVMLRGLHSAAQHKWRAAANTEFALRAYKITAEPNVGVHKVYSSPVCLG